MCPYTTSTEDKSWWVAEGAALERVFVAAVAPGLGIAARINPEKAVNPYAPDLLLERRLADLKVQSTPFFLAARYGFDPATTVTFNRKDWERYRRRYPEIELVFWLDWQETTGYGVRIPYVGGVWTCPFRRIDAMIAGGAPEHGYQRRRADVSGNGKSSFLLDVRRFDWVEVSRDPGWRFRIEQARREGLA